jgi:superfamily I DNA and RNA helicase
VADPLGQQPWQWSGTEVAALKWWPRCDSRHSSAGSLTVGVLRSVGEAAPYSLEQMFASAVEASLAALNQEQRQAVTHAGGPLLVLAGAGTGKTTTLCTRVAWLVDQGVSPERILLMTFTRRAAREMLSRARALVGPRATCR